MRLTEGTDYVLGSEGRKDGNHDLDVVLRVVVEHFLELMFFDESLVIEVVEFE